MTAPDDSPSGSNNLVTVGNYGDAQEAALARARLEQEGIVAFVQGESAANVLWHVGTALGGVLLQVAESDCDRALQILEGDAEGGSTGDVADEEWKCPECGVTVDAGFSVCWSCGAAYAESTDEPVDSPGIDANTDSGSPPEEASSQTGSDEDLEAMAVRAWKAAVIGIGFFPVIPYAIVLVLQLMTADLSPRGTRCFYGALAIVSMWMMAFLSIMFYTTGGRLQ